MCLKFIVLLQTVPLSLAYDCGNRSRLSVDGLQFFKEPCSAGSIPDIIFNSFTCQSENRVFVYNLLFKVTLIHFQCHQFSLTVNAYRLFSDGEKLDKKTPAYAGSDKFLCYNADVLFASVNR